MAIELTGAEIVLQVLRDQKVDTVFGYPGGAVLPIYDALFSCRDIRHILVRHEQGAAHAAEGYARTSGKPGVLLVTSGPGATNAVTGLTDALMDSVPLVCISGQVATHLIGTDAFQEADTVGITRSCTKHNHLVKSVGDLGRVLHEAFYVATHGRPGPVVVDIPKDIQFAKARYVKPKRPGHRTYRPVLTGDKAAIKKAAALLSGARRPIIYSGGGVINSGPRAIALLGELAQRLRAPVTSTLMGLGGYPASHPQWLGMLGMHGTYEANNAMHQCDVMLAVGARFDDRITGRVDAFSPGSRKIHIDIDRSSINKNVEVEVGIVGDCAHVLSALLPLCKRGNKAALAPWWKRIEKWRARKSLSYKNSDKIIKPQYAVERLYALTRNHDVYITTEVGQHQMWAAQHFHFEKPNHWMTSGGLGDYGLWLACGGRGAGGAPEGVGHRHCRGSLGADDDAGDVDSRAV